MNNIIQKKFRYEEDYNKLFAAFIGIIGGIWLEFYFCPKFEKENVKNNSPSLIKIMKQKVKAIK